MPPTKPIRIGSDREQLPNTIIRPSKMVPSPAQIPTLPRSMIIFSAHLESRQKVIPALAPNKTIGIQRIAPRLRLFAGEGRKLLDKRA